MLDLEVFVLLLTYHFFLYICWHSVLVC